MSDSRLDFYGILFAFLGMLLAPCADNSVVLGMMALGFAVGSLLCLTVNAIFAIVRWVIPYEKEER